MLGPGSVSWRINRERAMLLGGGCALLSQLAHPLVAAAVAEHSDFGSDPLARLRRTLSASLSLLFGTAAEAEAAAGRIRAAHDRVRGTLAEPAGRFPAGAPYRAQDPMLLAWVQATLLDTSLRTYEAFVAPIGIQDRRRYYEESSTIARMIGIPDGVRPPTYDEFVEEWERILSSDEIAVGGPARRLARDVLYPRIGRLPRRLFTPAAQATIGLLPPAVRERYGYRWTRAQDAIFRASAAAFRRSLRLAPQSVRVFPEARAAARRAG